MGRRNRRWDLTFDTIIEAVNCCIIIQQKSRDIDSLDLIFGNQGEILI